MKWNKKTVSLLAMLSLLLGGAGAIGLQAHAQQNPSTQQSVKPTETYSSTVGDQSNSDIQDAKDSNQPESALESYKQVRDNAGLPGGHQDQNGVNVNHQFEGVE
ncbi:hypothetical protein M1506_03025 [Patescibacteria group bacterium]|nr:hypothetical protein [Patescibacteria group bacterium]